MKGFTNYHECTEIVQEGTIKVQEVSRRCKKVQEIARRFRKVLQKLHGGQESNISLKKSQEEGLRRKFRRFQDGSKKVLEGSRWF